jgi:hypothetical protein
MESAMPRRLRLVRLLRSRGFRDAERLREDELVDALNRLDSLVVTTRSTPSSSTPSSHTRVVARTPGPRDDDLWDDAHALPFYREPKVVIPEGERSFLRLVAVDSHRLFLTWDLDPVLRARVASGGARGQLFVLDDERAPHAFDLDLSTSRWWLEAPAERATVMVQVVDHQGSVLLESNAAIVPPSSPAPPGPLVFATLSPRFDRRKLAHGPLLSERGLDGVSVRHAGVAPTTAERTSRPPASGAAPWVKGPPSSSESTAHAWSGTSGARR